MRRIQITAGLGAVILLGAMSLATVGCSSEPAGREPIVVNTLEDTASPQVDMTTLRSAIEQAESGQTITFAAALNGGTIELDIIGAEHSTLKGEVYSGAPPTFQGYEDRDYGKSALYARKDLEIDASSLPDGITIAWNGGDSNPARVLAVYGDLTMKNVAIRSGYSKAEAISSGSQPYTLARGGGLAVWGTAQLEDCTISGNRVLGDDTASRDRGAYGGGIYANGLELKGCVISGNSAAGYGAAGGGIYSVGGADNMGGYGNEATLDGCTVSGNRVTAQHAYGGGIFSLAGGPNNLAWMRLTNCTVARNLVEDNPLLADAGQFYYRGGGIYMGGGSLSVASSTIAENEVTGTPAIFSGKPNMGGGGIASTIGNAHVVEYVELWHSILVGNTLNDAAADVFCGSLLDFGSRGYNLIGAIDSSQILAPVPDWMMLSRKHYPKDGDLDGVAAADVLDIAGATYHASILSAGTDAGQPAVLWYPPAGAAVDRIPAQEYTLPWIFAGYQGWGVSTDDFLNNLLEKLRTDYAAILGSDFGTEFGDMTGVTWYGPAVTWPTNPENAAWITFWRSLDTAIGTSLGAIILGDDFWGTFTDGTFGNVQMDVETEYRSARLVTDDQLGHTRPSGTLGDAGAIEK